MVDASGPRTTAQRPALAHLVAQHAEEAVHLRHVRSFLARAPHIDLRQLERFDGRIVAHLDGLVVADPASGDQAFTSLPGDRASAVFAKAVVAGQRGDRAQLEGLIDAVGGVPVLRRGMMSALAWLSPSIAHELGTTLDTASTPWRRLVGHVFAGRQETRADVMRALQEDDTDIRATILRGIGRAGRREFAEACIAGIVDTDAGCAFEAARSALFLGERDRSLRHLERIAMEPGSPYATDAMRLFASVVERERARSALSLLAHEPARVRLLVHGVAATGEVHYVPWLLERIREPATARIATEALAFIIGIDVEGAGLDQPAPPMSDVAVDEVGADNVVVDEDDSLPWPDVEKVATWWRSNCDRFSGDARCFVGSAPTEATYVDVLCRGRQRQRRAAAERLALARPGAAIFNVFAPGWRQRRQLGTPGKITSTRD